MKILDHELSEYRSEIGKEKFRKIQINYCIKSKRIRDNNLRSSRKHYENSEEKLMEIKEKYKNGVTMDILKEFVRGSYANIYA